jgi:hypothetical protein
VPPRFAFSELFARMNAAFECKYADFDLSNESKPAIAIEPFESEVPMNNVLLEYEYAGSPIFNFTGTFVTNDLFIFIGVFAIF